MRRPGTFHKKVWLKCPVCGKESDYYFTVYHVICELKYSENPIKFRCTCGEPIYYTYVIDACEVYFRKKHQEMRKLEKRHRVKI